MIWLGCAVGIGMAFMGMALLAARIERYGALGA